MEHYLSLHGIPYGIQKPKLTVLYLDAKHWHGGNGIRMIIKATLSRPILWKYFILVFNVTLTIWGA